MSQRPSSQEPRLGTPVRRRDQLLWPIAIIVGFLVVIAVNVAFAYIAVSGADDVAPSYYSESR